MGNNNLFDVFIGIVTAPIRWVDKAFSTFDWYTAQGYSRFFVWALIFFILSKFTKFKGEVAIKK
jgi:hypothetical protein